MVPGVPASNKGKAAGAATGLAVAGAAASPQGQAAIGDAVDKTTGSTGGGSPTGDAAASTGGSSAPTPEPGFFDALNIDPVAVILIAIAVVVVLAIADRYSG